uniref:Grass carp reovirus (GCRV)-induced gene 2p n=1 Tax=Sparus aurata TaxID=8175 RepID=A0A671Y1B5_SPAAU
MGWIFHKSKEYKPQKRGVYTMYHGTSVASARLIIANGFKPSSGGMLGQGVYVSRDMKKASAYPRNATSSDRVIFKLRVRPGRVKRIDTFSHPLQYTWHSHGYDTAWLPPTGGLMCGLEEDCIMITDSQCKTLYVMLFKKMNLPNT